VKSRNVEGKRRKEEGQLETSAKNMDIRWQAGLRNLSPAGKLLT